MEHLNEILSKTVNGFTINSKSTGDYVNNPTNGINSNTVTAVSAEEIISMAKKTCRELEDEDSYAYHIFLARTIPHIELLKALSITHAAFERGVIQRKKIFYFRGVLHWLGFSTKSKNRGERKEKNI